MFEVLLTSEQLSALGSIVAESASLESNLNLMIARLARLSEAQLNILLGDQMLGRKLDIVKAAALLKLKSNRGKKRFIHLVDRVALLSRDRNTVVHGTWGDQQGRLPTRWICARAPDSAVYAVLHKRRGTKLRAFPAAQLKTLAKNMSEAHSELFSFLLEKLNPKKVTRHKSWKQKSNVA